VGSVPVLYTEDQLSLRQSPETAVTRAGGWCEMAASLREVQEHPLLEAATKQRSEVTQNTNICVIVICEV
jgi:hypothetical protein